MPFAKLPHNIITANIIEAIGNAIDRSGKDYLVASGGQKIYFSELNVGVYPDALAVCEKPEFYDSEQLLLTNPVLVVEVLSKSTRAYDYKGKFELYKTLPSFREYVLTEQSSVHVETRFQAGPQLWRDFTETNIDTELPLDALGFSITLKDIYKKVPELLE